MKKKLPLISIIGFAILGYFILFPKNKSTHITAPPIIPSNAPTPTPTLFLPTETQPLTYITDDNQYNLTINRPINENQCTYNISHSGQQLKLPPNFPLTISCTFNGLNLDNGFRQWKANHILIIENKPGILDILDPQNLTSTQKKYDSQKFFFINTNDDLTYFFVRKLNTQENEILYEITDSDFKEIKNTQTIIEFSDLEYPTNTLYDSINHGFLIISKKIKSEDTKQYNSIKINFISLDKLSTQIVLNTDFVEDKNNNECNDLTTKSEKGAIYLSNGCFTTPSNLINSNNVVKIKLPN